MELISPIALARTLAPCPPAPWEQGVKRHQQDCSLTARVILLRKICIALSPLANVPNGQILIFLGQGNERPGKWLYSPSGVSTESSGGTCWIGSLWVAKISGVSFIIEMDKAWELGTVSAWGLLSVPCDFVATHSWPRCVPPGVFPQVRREALLDATSPLLHLILLVKLSRKLPVRRGCR